MCHLLAKRNVFIVADHLRSLPSRLAHSGVETAAAINLLPLRGDDWVAEQEDPDQPVRPVEKQALAKLPLCDSRILAGDGNPFKKGAPPMIVYEHFWRMQPIAMSYVVRTRPGVPATAVARSIRAELAALDPEMAIMRPWTMEEIVEESVATRRFQLSLALSFAICALLLVSLGVYGVVSYSVAKRTPEIGIRSALGASQGAIVWTVVAQGMRPVVLGVAVGLVGAILAGRSIASQLFHVAPADPPTFAGVAVLLLTVGLAACYTPAVRAARIDPASALRFE
jgi:hypothetical protein